MSIKFEDITADAIRYLHHQMEAGERMAFEDLLDRQPRLREELELFRLVQAGFQELDKEQQARRGRGWPVAALLWLGLTFALLWGLLPVGAEDPGPPQKILAAADAPASALQITALGGDSPNPNSNRGYAVAWMPDGSITFGGCFEGQGQFGGQSFRSGGSTDFLLGNYDPESNQINWLLPFGGATNQDRIFDIAVHPTGSTVLTGDFSGSIDFLGQSLTARGQDNRFHNHDFFIAQLDPAGNLQWVDHNGGNFIPNAQSGRNLGRSVAIAPDGSVVATGAYLGSPVWGGDTLPQGGPNEDLYLAKYRFDGTLEWVRTVTGDYQVYGIGSVVDAAGNIYFAGSFGHHSLAGKAYFGSFEVDSRGGRDIFLAKYSPEGALLWVQQGGSAVAEFGYEAATDLAIDPAGNVLITGEFVGMAQFGGQSVQSRGGRDIFLAQYAPDGSLNWLRRASGPLEDWRIPESATALDVDAMGNIYVTGAIAGQADFEGQILQAGAAPVFFVAKYNSFGQLQWALPAMPAQGAEASGLAIDTRPDGTSVITGYFSGQVNFLGQTLQSQGLEDIFLLVIDPEGQVKLVHSTVVLA